MIRKIQGGRLEHIHAYACDKWLTILKLISKNLREKMTCNRSLSVVKWQQFFRKILILIFRSCCIEHCSKVFPKDKADILASFFFLLTKKFHFEWKKKRRRLIMASVAFIECVWVSLRIYCWFACSHLELSTQHESFYYLFALSINFKPAFCLQYFNKWKL